MTKYLQSGSLSRQQLATFAGDNRDQRGYLAWCGVWLAEALRVAKPGAALLMFTDWRQLPVTTDAIQVGGWVWRGIVPWHKPVNRPQRGRFSAACEYVVWATAGGRDEAFIDGALPGFWSCSAPKAGGRRHPTEKPLRLMRELVKIAPRGGRVLDPFGGSGTTGAACLLEGRRPTVVEITEHYANEIRARLGLITDPARTAVDTLFTEAGAL